MYRNDTSEGPFFNKELLLYALLSVLSFALITYGLLQHSSHKQQRLDIEYAERISNKLSAAFGSAAGILSSVTSFQQVLDDPYGDQLDSFAEKSIDSSKLIKSLARFERVEAEHLATFAQDMSESGMYNFSISSLSADGKKVPTQVSDVYYPIIWKSPFNPVSATLIGIDLSTNKKIFRSIRGGESTNSIQITAPPKGWNIGKDSYLMLIKPTYFGRYAPNSENKIASQSNGGVVMGIGLDEYIDELIEPGYDIQAWLNDTHQATSTGKSMVHETNGDLENNVFFKGIFSGITSTSTPLSANSSLQIVVRGHGGISKAILLQSTVVAAATYSILLVLFSMLYVFRQRDAVHKRERESALTTLRAIGDAVLTTNKERIITYVNPSAEQLLGISNSEIVGTQIDDTISFIETGADKSVSNSENSLIEALDSTNAIKLPTLQLNTKSNQAVYVSSTISPLSNDDVSRTSGHVMVMRDISIEQEMTRELAFLATHDSLTNISNRYHFEGELKKLVESSVTREKHHSICYIDLDQFKTINDTCGHSAGDKLLVRVSQGLTSIIRSNDVLARLGGDEFGLLITDCEENEAVSVAKRIYNFFQTLYFQHEQDVFAVRASIGFVHISNQFDNIEDVMAAADLACYSAKDRGRNELYIFNHFHNETSDRMSEMKWLPKLQMALRSDNFRLFVQPIVKIESSNNGVQAVPYQHYEILLRLLTEDGVLITPAQLIVAAERYNLMRDIDRWVVSNAMKMIASLHSQLGKNLPRFSINISGQTSVDSEFPEFISEQIESTGIDPATLIFEITETSAITNMQSALDLVNFLHDIGCKLALDDFGSGVSSFGYLKSLPVDYLKIDGQFIKNIDSNEVDREMVKCMCAVAKLLGIETVAEFVENEEILNVLTELNIDYAQGYLHGKPHAIEDLFVQSESDQSKAA